MINRLSALVMVVAVTVAGAALTRDPIPRTPVVFGRAPRLVQATLAADRPLGVSWYCPGVPATASEPGTITIVNPSGRPAALNLTFVPSNALAVHQSVLVAANARRDLSLAQLASAPITAVLVESREGSVLVEQTATTSAGEATTPCITSVSSRWFAADGSTSKSANYLLTLFNPFPADAVVDLALSTDAGRANVTGLYVPAGTVRVVDLGEQATRRKQSVAMTVDVVSGRVVAGRVLRFDGTSDRTGMVAGTLAPAGGLQFFVPDGVKGDGYAERYVVYNPEDRTANVEIAVYADAGAVTPKAITVAPQTAVSVDTFADNTVPAGAHRAVISSTNGVEIVVEQVVDTSAATGVAGIVSMTASQLSSTRWWFPVGSTAPGHREDITISNLTGSPAVISVRALGPGGISELANLSKVTIGPAASTTVSLSTSAPANDLLAIVIESSVPVVATRTLTVDGVIGVNRSLGIAER